MKNDSKKTAAMYMRFGRVESAYHNPYKHDSIDWKQMWEAYRKEHTKYPLSKVRI